MIDVIKPMPRWNQIAAVVSSCGPTTPVREFTFERPEERLGGSAVPAHSDRSHRLDHTKTRAKVPKLLRPVLVGFNRSSQHFEIKVADGQASRMDGGVDGAVADKVAWGALASA